MDETRRAKATIAALSNVLGQLESQIEPLLLQPLAETVIGLEPIQQIKLQTVIPYVVYDLIFIYLKTRGINPLTHPVVAELARIKQYFDKIKGAENPETKRMAIDKEAAGRFIKHAIAQAKAGAPYSATDTMQSTSNTGGSGNTAVPAKVTVKMRAREAYLRELSQRGDASDEDMEDLPDFEDPEHEGGSDAMDVDSALKSLSKDAKGKGKASEIPPEVEEVGRKRKRAKAVDFITGPSSTPPTPEDAHTPDPSTSTMPRSKTRQKNKKKRLLDMPTTVGPDTQPLSSVSDISVSGSPRTVPSSKDEKMYRIRKAA